MKLLKLSTDGFGSLRGERAFDPERLTLMVDDNERGKSTLLAAIAAALYGLSDDKRSHRPITPLERWRPWDGGPFTVELELECAGERYTVSRDFQNGAVAVWNGRGQELTARFLDGRDEYPVGKILLGLDAEEFEKCAFVRQDDLDQVVPADERDRRTNSLQARLERAADTRAGNSSANEALRVLDEAAARYSEPLLDTTLRVENAIQRLDTKIQTLDAEIHALEHDDASIRPQLDRLARIEEEERSELEREQRINAERRAALGAEARAKLERHQQARAELERLEQEAAGLAPFAGVPADSDGEFRQAVARLEESERQRRQLEADHELFASGIQHLDVELEKLGAFASLGEADADRFIAHAAELRRVQAEHDRLRAELDRVRADLAAKGFDAGVIERLRTRFGSIAGPPGALLAGQPALALELQTRTAEADLELERCGDLIAEIGRARRSRVVPAAILLGLALAAGVLAVLQAKLELFAAQWQLIAAGAALAGLVGAVLLVLAARFRTSERRRAREERVAARRSLAELADRREANQRELRGIAQATGCDDTSDLLRSWSRRCISSASSRRSTPCAGACCNRPATPTTRRFWTKRQKACARAR